jgi:hypothetical protein
MFRAASQDRAHGGRAIARNDAVLKILATGTRIACLTGMSVLRTFSLIVGGALLALGGSALASFL